MKGPRSQLPALALALALLQTGAVSVWGDIAVLYDPDRGGAGTTETLVDQEWQNVSSDLFNQTGFYFGFGGVTEFDSGPENSLIAGFGTHGGFTGDPLHPNAQVLDPLAGFRLRFELGIDAEVHSLTEDFNMDGTADRSGFSVMMLGSDTRGVLLGFWEDRIWAYDDDSDETINLLCQAEFIEQDRAQMASLRTYELLMAGNDYQFSSGGKVLLEGRRRDYSNWPGVVVPGFGVLSAFDKANNITFGDPSDEALAVARIGEIVVETDPGPEPPEITSIETISGKGSDALRLEWSAFPGEGYSIQESADLMSWIELNDMLADAFTAEHVQPIVPGVDRAFYRVEMLADNE